MSYGFDRKVSAETGARQDNLNIKTTNCFEYDKNGVRDFTIAGEDSFVSSLSGVYASMPRMLDVK